MFVIIGLVMLFGCVFGFYILHHGPMAPIIEAAPTEMGIIFGAGVAAMVIGNSIEVLKGVGGGLGKCFGGPAYKKQDYQDTITLIVKLFKLFKAEGAVALEPHIENPEASSVFGEYPKLLKDHDLIAMICDTIRLLVTSNQPFREWDEIFPSGSMTVAAVDRLVHHCHIVGIKGDSYRQKAAAARVSGDAIDPPT